MSKDMFCLHQLNVSEDIGLESSGSVLWDKTMLPISYVCLTPGMGLLGTIQVRKSNL